MNEWKMKKCGKVLCDEWKRVFLACIFAFLFLVLCICPHAKQHAKIRKRWVPAVDFGMKICLILSIFVWFWEIFGDFLMIFRGLLMKFNLKCWKFWNLISFCMDLIFNKIHLLYAHFHAQEIFWGGFQISLYVWKILGGFGIFSQKTLENLNSFPKR